MGIIAAIFCRKSHNFRTVKRRVYIAPAPDSWRSVVDKMYQYRKICRRCGEPKGPWVNIEDSRDSIQSWSCPSWMADKVNRGGVVEC